MENSTPTTNGLSHVALVCSDMAATTRFWEKLGIPLVKMENLPGGGQHSFHDMGNGALLSYMSFPGAPPAAPGIASQPLDIQKDGAKTAVASMNHVALDLPAESFDAVLENLRSQGLSVRTINHGSAEPFGENPDSDTWIRSMYFRDPDGIAFEFASLLRPLGSAEDLAPDVLDANGQPSGYIPVLSR